jgi:hypothetical protein
LVEFLEHQCPIRARPRLTVKLTGSLTGAGKEKVQDEVIAALQAYVDGLTAGEPALGGELLAAITAGVPDVENPVIKDVLVWRADIGSATGERIPDRSLLQEATDEQLESGAFQVSATVDGEPWFVVLDMERADVVLEED